ncbi:MAG: CHAT domain-containing protein, partial [Leptolyngbyaceae cyanobacterium MAG.088]|nr:CHAT domain-containing protein [Leptolyngbyaceae cyanobacterium MAG.088]
LIFRFSNPGSIINAADLNLGETSSLTLTGGTVVSTGTISAGDVAIASVPGEQLISLNPDGSLLSYDILPSDDEFSPLGLSPLSLPELLTGAGDVVNTLGNTLQVDTDGTVRLVNSDLAIPDDPGTTLVNGTITAGEITLLGDTVGVIDSLLDASSPNGGGAIYVGGSYQGQGPLPNAKITYISADSVLDASATVNGNGGEIIVWSDQTTHVLGDLLARGGATGGDGGLVETSGLLGLTVDGNPDVSAPVGNGGLWLIDPFDVLITDSAGSNGFDPADPFTPIASPAILSVFDIESALSSGADVTITTGTTGNETGNITLDSNLFFDTLEGEVTLSLEAAGSIFIDGAIIPLSSIANPLNIELTADVDNTGNGQVVFDNQTFLGSPGFPITVIDTAGGDLTVTANSSNLTGEPAILLAADNVIATNEFGVEGLPINGSVTFNGTAGEGSLGIKLEENSEFDVGENITLISNQDIEVDTLEAGGNITITTPEFFRALGSFDISNPEFEEEPLFVSILSDSGQVAITHGGNEEIPFIVGDPTENGTEAAIIATRSEILPEESIPGDFVQGDISVATGEPDDMDDMDDDMDDDDMDDMDDDDMDDMDDMDDELPDVDDCTADCTTPISRPNPPGGDPNTPIISIEPELLPDVEQAILLKEIEYTDEFRGHLNLDGEEAFNPKLPQLQEQLVLAAEETGEPTAIVYVSFVPPTETGNYDQVLPKQAQTIEGTEILELVVITPEGPPILKTLPVNEAEVKATADQFLKNVVNRGRVNRRTYLSAAKQLNDWLIAPLEAELHRRGITNIAFVMPSGLRSLPVSALHNGDQFLVERFSVGLMPSVSLTDLRYVDVRNTEVLAMGASVFDDQPELPAVPLELNTIAEQLWPGDFVINETFTPDSLITSRARKPYGILHLATHGEFKAGDLNQSYIQFWDQRLSLDQVRSLGLNNPPVELLVLSACRTALGNEDAELGFAGLAIQAGVKTAVASLWKVDDVGTAGLMTQFYTSLQTEPIKAEALRQAQLAMINGDIQVKDGQLIWSGGALQLPDNLAEIDSSLFAHPYFWASFTTIGSPW